MAPPGENQYGYDEMYSAPDRLSSEDMHPIKFRFRGGSLCLDLTATMVGRHRDPVDQLHSLDGTGRWLREAGLVAQPPEVRTSEIANVRELRESIYRLIHPATRDAPAPEDIRTVNYFASHDGLYPVLAADARTAANFSPHLVQACLSVLARDAIRLLTTPDLARVRECARPDCSVLFLDASRSGRRRWCDMTRCGNQAKASLHRRRQLVSEGE
jgi:predicted RNA-binding Zn ribbon-like protein